MSVRVKLNLYMQEGYVFLTEEQLRCPITRPPGGPTEIRVNKRTKYLVIDTPDEIQEEITYKRSALEKQSQSWGIAQW